MRTPVAGIAARVAAWAVLAVAASGCAGEETIAITLARVAPPGAEDCGAPADARTLIVTALGEHPPSGATAFAPDLTVGGALRVPVSTRVVAIEVLGAAGVLRTVGRTAPFEVAELDDGASLAIAMAPPRGFCPVGPMAEARIAPLVAPAAGGVLVAGGAGARRVEWYDPARGAFEDLGEALYGGSNTGLIGASMTALDDGRVVVAGGARPAFQLFDPETMRFGSALLLEEARARHAAVALADGRVLLAGGCAELDAEGACVPGTALASSMILDVDRAELTSGPPLLAPRIDALAIREPGGGVLLVGGHDGDGQAHRAGERIDVAAGVAEPVADLAALVAAPLVSGSALAISDEGGLSMLAPGATAVAPLGFAPQLASVTASSLEDGRVLVIGGGVAALVAPGTGRVADLADAPGAAQAAARWDHAATRLPDGSVLVVGGRDEHGAGRDDAQLFRPDLTGPFTSGAAIAFGSRELAEQVVPRDAARAEFLAASGQVPAHLRVVSSGDGAHGLATEWAVVAGPRFSAPKLELRLGADDGAAVLLAFRDPERRWELRLREGQAPELWQLEGAEALRARGCDATPVPQGALGSASRTEPIAVEVSGAGLRARAGGEEVLACAEVRELPFGHVGVAPLGADGAAVRIDALLVER
jgi:hypothetical protein